MADIVGNTAAPTAQESKKAKAEPAAEQVLSLTAKDLATIIENAQLKAAEVIAKALVESKKPYVDPAQEANKEAARQSMRTTAQRIRSEIEAARDQCEHKQGSNPLSRFTSEASSFVLHRLDTGETIGICTNCQKIISSLNPEHHPYFRRKSGNIPSAAGQRQFMDPTKAQMNGRLLNEDGTRSIGQ